MKSSFLKFIENFLRKQTVKVLEKYQPEIIGITGSNGKSSTKEAIACVLKAKFSVLPSFGNYNTELGIPLSILEQKMPRWNIGWLIIILKSFFYTFFHKNYYEKLVLELAADKPGDIAYLTEFIKPKISVLTNISATHLKEFKSVSAVASEKEVLIEKTERNGFLCLNKDDECIRRMATDRPQKIIWYGTDNSANIWASNFEQNLFGLKFNINYKNDSLPIIINGTLGKHLAYPALAACACGLIYNISLGKSIHQLKGLSLPKGRMRIILGIKNSTIIDDSYNANPSSMLAALTTINELDQQKIIKGRKIGVLGTMNELGKYKKEGHEKVGQKAAESLDYLITIGKAANQYLASKAHQEGLVKHKIFNFNDSQKAGKFLNSFIENNDIILVKGSQNNVRTEWVVEQIMAKPEKASDLLVRQEPSWKKPKFKRD
jgi:UDP-N-acetylmuramoyl-tripeptide--D-alanyl-D-alanine ligase